MTHTNTLLRELALASLPTLCLTATTFHGGCTTLALVEPKKDPYAQDNAEQRAKTEASIAKIEATDFKAEGDIRFFFHTVLPDLHDDFDPRYKWSAEQAASLQERLMSQEKRAVIEYASAASSGSAKSQTTSEILAAAKDYPSPFRESLQETIQAELTKLQGISEKPEPNRCVIDGSGMGSWIAKAGSTVSVVCQTDKKYDASSLLGELYSIDRGESHQFESVVGAQVSGKTVKFTFKYAGAMPFIFKVQHSRVDGKAWVDGVYKDHYAYDTVAQGYFIQVP